jgi:hypothetical protein
LSDYDIAKEGTFLWHWERFCESLYPKVFKKNPMAFLIAGMSLLTLAHRAYVLRSRPMPCNFFIGLIGKPASGKGRVIDCIRLAIQDSPMIDEIPTGSAEAIELGVEERKYGYLIWDEIGELAEKSGEYLRRVKYLINKMYYLDRITRYKVTKRSVDIPANSYYVNVIFSGLEEDWAEVENTFLGGFERRFIKVKMDRAVSLFEDEEPSKEAWKHCYWIREYLRNHAHEIWFIKPVKLSQLKNVVSTLDEKYWTAAEEYSYKIAAALLLNESMGVIGTVNGVEVKSIHSDDAPLEVSDAGVYAMLHSTNGKHQETAVNFLSWSLKRLFDINQIADKRVAKILSVIEERLKDPSDKGYMKKKEFVREFLKSTNSLYYKPIVELLEEAGVIKIIDGGAFGIRGQIVIYNHDARICANCKHSRECASQNGGKVPINTAESCARFERIDE